jgi:hypothetical protein
VGRERGLQPHAANLNTGGFPCQAPVILDTFGSYVHNGQIVKSYENEEMVRYAPPEVIKTGRRCAQYVEDLMTICTSHIERFNCTTQQLVKRFCRLTFSFSMRHENIKSAVAMHIANYNFCWRIRLLDNTSKQRSTAAMMAAVVDNLWTFEDLYRHM